MDCNRFFGFCDCNQVWKVRIQYLKKRSRRTSISKISPAYFFWLKRTLGGDFMNFGDTMLPYNRQDKTQAIVFISKYLNWTAVKGLTVKYPSRIQLNTEEC